MGNNLGTDGRQAIPYSSMVGISITGVPTEENASLSVSPGDMMSSSTAKPRQPSQTPVSVLVSPRMGRLSPFVVRVDDSETSYPRPFVSLGMSYPIERGKEPPLASWPVL